MGQIERKNNSRIPVIVLSTLALILAIISQVVSSMEFDLGMSLSFIISLLPFILLFLYSFIYLKVQNAKIVIPLVLLLLVVDSFNSPFVKTRFFNSRLFLYPPFLYGALISGSIILGIICLVKGFNLNYSYGIVVVGVLVYEIIIEFILLKSVMAGNTDIYFILINYGKTFSSIVFMTTLFLLINQMPALHLQLRKEKREDHV